MKLKIAFTSARRWKQCAPPRATPSLSVVKESLNVVKPFETLLNRKAVSSREGRSGGCKQHPYCPQIRFVSQA